MGAGPTGLTLGIDLARRSIAAPVVERAPALFPGSRGKGIQPRTQEVCDNLGVIDAIRAASGPYPSRMVWRDGEESRIERFEPDEGTPYPEPRMIPQWRTQEILCARLLKLGGKVAFGREATGLAQDAEGVEVTFADGTTLRARYVVAADGGRSVLRRALGVGMSGETVDPAPFVVTDLRVRAWAGSTGTPSRGRTAASSGCARWPAPRSCSRPRGCRRTRSRTSQPTASATWSPGTPTWPPRT